MGYTNVDDAITAVIAMDELVALGGHAVGRASMATLGLII
jgi:hypothetical protein